MDDKQLIYQLRHGPEEAFRALYRTYRLAFVQWAMRLYGCRQAEAVDAFQESVVILYEKIQGDELPELNSSLKTYLFAIGKRRLHKQFSKEMVVQHDFAGLDRQVEAYSSQLEVSELGREIARLVAALPHPCNQLMYWYYYRNFSMEAIANRMNYKSADVAKTQKNRCSKRLKKLARQAGLML